MRWGVLATLGAGILAALTLAQLAPGLATERIRVVRPGAAIPNNLYLVIRSPDDYSRVALRGTSGSWTGPTYWLPDDPAVRNTATIDWEVGYDERPLNTERIALSNLTRDWAEDQRAGVSIPHYVGRRNVGTIPGVFILQVERRSAPAELVLAVPVAPRLHTFIRFLLLRPETDSFFVKGSILASSWNRGQALLAMSRVRLEGNLPPSLVTIRTRRKGVLGGFAVDMHRHAVVGSPVALERRSGGRWRRIANARTTRIGGYTFRVRPGSYRVTATLDGRFSATSRPIRARG